MTNAISYTNFYSRSHDAVIRVYGDAMRLTPTPNGKNGPAQLAGRWRV